LCKEASSNTNDGKDHRDDADDEINDTSKARDETKSLKKNEHFCMSYGRQVRTKRQAHMTNRTIWRIPTALSSSRMLR
jgi:hypothetical protein